MDFLDPKKKRKHAVRLFVGYCLMGTALLLASVLLLFSAFGYGINRSTGEVIQNGLVFVDAHPEPAEMYLNGQDKGQTDGRFVLEAGTYNVELKRDGYRSWKRDFTLEGGNIVRLVYPFLFPELLSSSDVQVLPEAPDLVTQSPDRRWIITHTASSQTTFSVVDANAKELPSETLSVPAELFAGRTGTQALSLVEWSTNNRHVLLKNTYSGGYDYIVLDRENPTESLNLTTVFGTAYSTVTLRDKKADQFYMHVSATGELFSGDAKNTRTTPVLTNVVNFWPYKESTVVYTTNQQAPDGKTLMKVKDGQVNYQIRELTRSDASLLNMAEFDGDTYIVGGSPTDGKVYIYKNPIDALKKSSAITLNPTMLLKLDGAEFISFSGNARFISVQSGSMFAVYDIETKQHYKYDTKLNLARGQKAIWMDGHRLTSVAPDSMLKVFDYDGLNTQSLVSGYVSYVPLFDRDYNQLFTLSPSGLDTSKPALVRTDLNLGKQ